MCARRAKFKMVVEVKDEDVLQKIHQNYRMTYIKDAILLRYLDDATLGTLSSMIFFNNVVIVSRLSDNPEFMQELFSKMLYLAPLANLKATGQGAGAGAGDGKAAAAGSAESKSVAKPESRLNGPVRKSFGDKSIKERKEEEKAIIASAWSLRFRPALLTH
jgi:hypothetical protein